MLSASDQIHVRKAVIISAIHVVIRLIVTRVIQHQERSHQNRFQDLQSKITKLLQQQYHNISWFDTNQKHVCDLFLVIITNLGRLLSCTFSEILRLKARKSPILHYLLHTHLTP